MALEEPSEAVRRTDVTARTEQEFLVERREAERRRSAMLKVILVTLTWLVSVPLLIGWEVTGAPATVPVPAYLQRGDGDGGGPGYLLAAVLAVLLPFVAGVIATKNRRFFLGGCYVALTLAMVVPAVSIARMGN